MADSCRNVRRRPCQPFGDAADLVWYNQHSYLQASLEMSSVADRLNALESEVSVLREQLNRETDWIVRVSGSMNEYPEFDDVLRYGRDARRNGTDDGSSNGS